MPANTQIENVLIQNAVSFGITKYLILENPKIMLLTIRLPCKPQLRKKITKL